MSLIRAGLCVRMAHDLVRRLLEPAYLRCCATDERIAIGSAPKTAVRPFAGGKVEADAPLARLRDHGQVVRSCCPLNDVDRCLTDSLPQVRRFVRPAATHRCRRLLRLPVRAARHGPVSCRIVQAERVEWSSACVALLAPGPPSPLRDADRCFVSAVKAVSRPRLRKTTDAQLHEILADFDAWLARLPDSLQFAGPDSSVQAGVMYSLLVCFEVCRGAMQFLQRLS